MRVCNRGRYYCILFVLCCYQTFLVLFSDITFLGLGVTETVGVLVRLVYRPLFLSDITFAQQHELCLFVFNTLRPLFRLRVPR